MGEIDYRAEEPGDEADVHEVVRRAFSHHAGVDALVADLRASDGWLGLSFVATLDGAVVAHVAFTRSRLDARAALVDVLVLSPLSVAPAHQGRGIATALVRYALRRLQARPEPLVFLEGSPRYYARFGFAPAAPVGFRRPSLRIPEAAFQVLALPADDGSWSGTLVYHRAFWDHDAVGLRPG
ncbi:MAG: N-acetyltransferase [Lapillicoccus sp.]